MKIEYIAWKGLSTKSIVDRVITAHFTVPSSFLAKDFINKPLVLKLSPKDREHTMEVDATMCTDPGTSYYYNPTHDTYAIKLDITLPDLLIMGYLFISHLDLEVEDNKI